MSTERLHLVMDSGSLLNLLGNENRRHILRLLSRKPCYVTEISEYLDVSPKAIIDHLNRLEEAGLVTSETDDRRRKYFHIARNVRLEVTVSPYGFGTKSAYPADTSLDLGHCSHLSITVGDDGGEDPRTVASELAELRELERELSLAQRWVHGRITDRQAKLNEALPTDDAHERVYADVLVALAREPRSTSTLASNLDAPARLVHEALSVLRERDLIEQSSDEWQLRSRR